MKKTKRIIALAMVLTLMFSFIAMSASAASTEIQPKGIACDCGSSNTRTTEYAHVRTNSMWVNGCSQNPSVGHYHALYKKIFEFKCYTCGENYTYYGSSYVVCEN